MDSTVKKACCWNATAPITSYPRLEGRERVEVAVVGGGIVGLSAALPLAQAGRKIAALEGEQIRHGPLLDWEFRL